jgi:signal transduction histidine kinase
LFICLSTFSIFKFDPFVDYAVKVLNVIAPVYFLVCLASRKTKITLFLLIGWIPFLISLFLVALIFDGIFYNEFLRVHAIELGMAWEVTAFSLVLGYRFNLVRKEKMKMQAENLRLVSEQNQLLEKKVAERTHEVEEQKQELQAQNEELVTQHEKLAEQNATIENQKHEVQAQNEELVAQQDKLVEQNAVIESQNKQLNEYNINLEGLVAARTKDLELANAELAHRYEQVTEFAFMTAHNLRGPVSRMIGLNNLIQQEQTFDKEIIGMLGTTAKDVDQVLRDIATVLDIKETHKIAFEHFDLTTLVDEILSEFSSTIENVQASVNTDLNFREVYSSRNFLRSVLTQLIENSIKFRKPDVRLTIDISSEVKESSMIIRVADNGLGLDMDLFKEKIFRLYQRYHTHREGKGFGLYLSRIMIESLGGKILAVGRLDNGTAITIVLPLPSREVL